MSTLVQPTSLDSGNRRRLASLDQFRGYTVVGMLLVNYLGGYEVCPQVWKHSHDYCSYADTIMPQFLFAVGFALRLTVGRKLQSQGQDAATYLRIVRRLLGLVLVSLVVYNVQLKVEHWETLRSMGWSALAEPLKRTWFQTLMHIAVTSLWILPVISAKLPTRLAWMIASGLLHVLLSYQFNFVWCHTEPRAIDGGPLGFLTWCIPALLGSMACDWFVDGIATGHRAAPTIVKALAVSFVFMMLGYCLSCGTRLYDVPVGDQLASQEVASLVSTKLAPDPVWPSSVRIRSKLALGNSTSWLAEPPLVKPPGPEFRQWNYWMMSQRAATVAYPTFCAGFGLLVFILFYLACDVGGYQWSVFRTFGTNALVAYVLHDMVSNAVQPFFPKDSPVWFATTGLILFFVVNWIIVRALEKQNIFLRV